jgi:integron integrase
MKPEEAVKKLVEVLRLRHYSFDTERCYVSWLRRFMRAASTDKTSTTSEARVERFLTQLARADVSASTQNQAFNAILFFYRDVLKTPLQNISALRARRPARLRHAPSRADVAAMFDNLKDLGGYPTRLIVGLIYGSGLRVSEPLNLRIKDVDLAASRLTIRAAKGDKDRVVPIPCRLMPDLAAQIKFAEAVSARDKASGIPVPLPGRLAIKYPSYQFSKGWAWLFPACSTCRHPRTGETVRWHCLDVTVQRAVRAAVISADLATPFTPHHLRHGYATHAMEAGAMVRDLQAVMGHVSLETTAGYLHPEAGRVISPLDSLAGV